MRILAITNLFPNPLQPTKGTFNFQTLAALARTNSVEVISPIPWTDEWRDRLKRSGKKPVQRVMELEGMKVYHPTYYYTPKFFRDHYGDFYYRSIRGVVDASCRSFDPEVVLGLWAFPDGWAALKHARRKKLPCAIVVHGCDVRSIGKMKGRIKRTTDTLRDADHVIAVSKDLAERSIEMGASRDRVSVIYRGLDANRFFPGDRLEARKKLGLDADRKYLLFVGNHERIKGGDVLIEALAKLKAEGKSPENYQFLFIGDGPELNLWRSMGRQLGLGETLLFLGRKPHRELPMYFRAADLFVLPSRSEGVPNVLIEAMACGLPWLASRIGGVPEIAGQGVSRMATSESPTDFALALEDFFSGKWPNQAPPPIATRSYEDSAAEYMTVFENLVASRRQGVVAH